MKNFYSISDISRIIGVRKHRIDYCIQNDFVEVCPLYFCGKRMFTKDDIEILKNYFSGKDIK